MILEPLSDNEIVQKHVNKASEVLQGGGIIAYPTEYCFGLGCDPRDSSAVERLLKIKQRKAEQGLILIAGDLSQVTQYAELESVPNIEQIAQTWPGPNTWLLPAKDHVPDHVRGKHTQIAMRIPDHEFCLLLLAQFNHPIVSTSANRSGQKEHLTASSLDIDMGVECDYIVNLPVGGQKRASSIRDSMTGKLLR